MRKRIWRAGGTVGIALSHRALDGDGAFHRLLDAPELGENAVPGGVLNASAVRFDQRQDDGLMSLEGRDSGGLVLGHQAAIPDDIRHQDGGEPALNVCLVHVAPRPKTDFSINAMLKHVALGVHRWPEAGRMALVQTHRRYLATKPP